jgi:hypothetical protein
MVVAKCRPNGMGRHHYVQKCFGRRSLGVGDWLADRSISAVDWLERPSQDDPNPARLRQEPGTGDKFRASFQLSRNITIHGK